MLGEWADLFVQRGWRCFRYGDDRAYLADAEEGYLSAAPDSLIATGLASHARSDATLREVIQGRMTRAVPARQPRGLASELHLSLLGGRLLVRFANAACRNDVEEYFSCSSDRSESSPDVVVECDWERAGRHLFRARPDYLEGVPLEGVRVRPRGAASCEPWRSAHPPLPPLAVPPFRDRFVALHAATVRTPHGHGIAVAGASGSGKTTCALELAPRPGFEFLADETTFVHLRTNVAEPFPHSVGVWSERDGKTRIPPDELFPRVSRLPVLIHNLFVLERTEDGSMGVEELSPLRAFRALLPHHRDACAPMDEVLVTLDHLVRSVRVARVTYCHHQDLPGLIDELLLMAGS